jgi:hypothetical protein
LDDVIIRKTETLFIFSLKSSATLRPQKFNVSIDT